MKQSIDLDLFIKELLKRQRDLLSRFDELNAALEDVAQQLAMAEAVRASYQRYFRLPMALNEHDEQLRSKFAHMSIKDMLTHIAMEHDGILDVGKARDILVRAGIFKDERNASTSIAPIVRRHENVFKRVGRGFYVLIGKPAQDPWADKASFPSSAYSHGISPGVSQAPTSRALVAASVYFDNQKQIPIFSKEADGAHR